MMKVGAGLLLVVGGLSAARECAGQALGLRVEKDGAFAVSLDGRPWLAGAETRVGEASAAQGDLVSTASDTHAHASDTMRVETAAFGARDLNRCGGMRRRCRWGCPRRAAARTSLGRSSRRR